MEANVNITRKRENTVIRAALLVTALPFFALGVTLLPVIGLLIGFALGGIALSPWQESPLRVIKVMIGGGLNNRSHSGESQNRPESIPVTVLSASRARGDDMDFDATQIDAETVRFGPQASKPIRKTIRQSDSDAGSKAETGRVFYFPANAAGLATEDHTVCITGETKTGEAFRGCGKLAA